MLQLLITKDNLDYLLLWLYLRLLLLLAQTRGTETTRFRGNDPSTFGYVWILSL